MKKSPPVTVDQYIAAFPPHVKEILVTLRATIRVAAPDAIETIKYGIPTFVLNGNLVHFGAYKHHIGFYPTPSAIQAFEQELSPYKHEKGSIQFPLDKPLPHKLITKIVLARVKETRNTSKH